MAIVRLEDWVGKRIEARIDDSQIEIRAEVLVSDFGGDRVWLAAIDPAMNEIDGPQDAMTITEEDEHTYEPVVYV